MPINIEITATPDAKALAVIHGECFGQGQGWDAPAIQAMLAIKGTAAFVAAGYTGFGLLRALEGDAEILTLAVLPQYRKRGIGEAITASMQQWARHQGTERMFLEVRESNEAAQALYQKMGFAVISLRKEYYRNTDGPYESAIVMQWQA